LFGCIQTSFFIGKILFKVNVKNQGSKNAGASNGVLLFGWAYGVFIGLVDLMKAYIPVSICLTLTQFDMFLASIVGGGVILGHIYPFFMNFNGGKGMSSYFGMILALDFSFGMILLFLSAIFLMVTNYVAVATILILIIVPSREFFQSSYMHNHLEFVLSLLFFSMLIISKHLENLIKIKNGTETTFWSVFKK
tara:strand:+ start:1426 stop:2004 length:579 start_codon:yes stop_codon:yes gene_type:complete